MFFIGWCLKKLKCLVRTYRLTLLESCTKPTQIRIPSLGKCRFNFILIISFFTLQQFLTCNRNSSETKDGKVMVPLQFMLEGRSMQVFGFGSNKTTAKKAAAKLALRQLCVKSWSIQSNRLLVFLICCFLINYFVRCLKNLQSSRYNI